jgi:heme oxygenase
MTPATLIESSRSQRLRDATHDAHERLDQSLMARDSFRSRAGYVPFLTMQFAFHRDIAALYADPRLEVWLPGLAARSRLALLEQDMADLGVAAPVARPPLFTPTTLPSPATALGWLYVAEGSNLGAALLRKMVAGIGLSDSHGARHLAPAAEGPAAHWRRFVAVLDTAPLDQAEEDAAIAGARAAFAHVAGLADGQLG